MITPLCAAVTVLAVARITRLITEDYVLSRPRAWIVNRAGTGSALAYLVTCPWCMSVWVAGGMAPVAWWWGGTPGYLIPALALAASHVAGLLSSVGGDE